MGVPLLNQFVCNDIFLIKDVLDDLSDEIASRLGFFTVGETALVESSAAGQNQPRDLFRTTQDVVQRCQSAKRITAQNELIQVQRVNNLCNMGCKIGNRLHAFLTAIWLLINRKLRCDNSIVTRQLLHYMRPMFGCTEQSMQEHYRVLAGSHLQNSFRLTRH